MSKKIYLLLTLFIWVASTSLAHAGFSSTGKISGITIQDYGSSVPYVSFGVEFRTIGSPDCAASAKHFLIPLNTDLGQSMYSFLLAAKLADKSIKVGHSGNCTIQSWYEDVDYIQFDE